MRLLIDTHVLLWFVDNDPQLSKRASALISDPSNDVLVSMASLWEMAIKFSGGKLKLQPDFAGFVSAHLAANDFEILPIETLHLAEVAHLPFHHRDPFDRLLIAQSRAENIPLISADVAFDAYGIKRLWS